MRNLIAILLFLLSSIAFSQGYNIYTMSDMPEPVSNNAVTHGWVNDTGYVYSFGGIDSTKVWSGIHLKSWRYNTVTDVWDTIPNLPDTLGKIAASASYIDSIIYIIGGYHVYANSNEASSAKVHRFDTRTNTYLSDGADIPVPIDDHVQAVYKDSLIYVITGWSNTGNVPNVQIYDPANDTWYVGNPVPTSSLYMSFGASGTIYGDLIYYMGGATNGFNFPSTNRVRWGYINPSDPTQITWNDMATPYKLYRSVCILNDQFYHSVDWLGGSSVSYNYNGIAYNGSGGVSPRPRYNVYTLAGGTPGIMTEPIYGVSDSLPMDLRGYAGPFNGYDYYIVGGMEANQKVSNKTLRLNRYIIFGIEEEIESSFSVFPNPTSDILIINSNKTIEKTIEVSNSIGQIVLNTTSSAKSTKLNLEKLKPGLYYIRLSTKNSSSTQKIIRQ